MSAMFVPNTDPADEVAPERVPAQEESLPNAVMSYDVVMGRPKRRKMGCGGCLTILAISVVVFFAPWVDTIRGFVPALSQILENFPEIMGWVTIEPVETPTTFDPLAYLPRAKQMAGPRAQLVQIRAFQIRRDGTVNLMEGGEVQYEFSVPTASGASFQRIDVWVSRPNTRRTLPRFGTSFSYINRGVSRIESELNASRQFIIAPLACTFTELWEKAIALGTPINREANIFYTRSGFEFSIEGRTTNIRFTPRCVAQ
jgi:hypothetical protein